MSSNKTRKYKTSRNRRLAKASNWTRDGRGNFSKAGHGGSEMRSYLFLNKKIPIFNRKKQNKQNIYTGGPVSSPPVVTPL